MSNKNSNSGSSVIDENSKATSAMDGKEISLKEYNKTAPLSFNVKNYRLLLIGLAINILGFILMIGGGAEDPNEFDASELFSHTRITIAPMLIVGGYVVILLSIMKKPKAE
ncbi:MAG: DUF3098 domain-containing protein [Crocinitomicaceae bacterium]|nr:DUF3098 domain-containing protein [Crocinitomicaceae bacterium]